MKKTVFLEKIQELLEVDIPLTETTNLTDLEEFDSLAIMSLIAMIHANFQKTVKGSELQQINTAEDLMALIGMEHFMD